MLSAMLMCAASSGTSAPAGPETGTKGFYVDDRATDGWVLQDTRNSSSVDGTYGRWYSYDGTSNISKTFGTLGTSFVKMRIGTFSNCSYEMSYEGSGGRTIKLVANSFGSGAHDYVITAYVDGSSVGSASIPGPGDVYDPRSFIALEYVHTINAYRFIADDVVYLTHFDTRLFDKMRVGFNRNWNGFGIYGVSEMSWYVA